MNTITQAEARGTAAATTASSQLSRTAAGAALLGAVFTLPVAVDAAVVYHFEGTTVDLGGTSGFTGIPINMDGAGPVEFFGAVARDGTFYGAYLGPGSFAPSPNAGFFSVGGEGSVAFNFQGSQFVGDGQVQSLAPFAVLNGYDFTSSQQSGNFAFSQVGVAGVQFQLPGSTSNAAPTTHYGWIRLHVGDFEGDGLANSLTIIDWAYETSGDPIHVPNGEPIPEANPGLILLAAGGTGLAAWRMRRRQAAKATAQA